LQNAKGKFQARGIGLAAISYDSEAILKDFSQRRGIDYPLLSDTESRIITAYGALNPQASGMAKGVPFPGYVFIAPDGRVREKFFGVSYSDRMTANNLLAHLFPELTEEARRTLPAPHIKLSVMQSDTTAVPGSIVRLVVQVSLPSDVHIYAPGVAGYKPAKLSLKLPPELAEAGTKYPSSRTLLLPAINESVPVLEGTFVITQDVMVSSERDFLASLGSGRRLRVEGGFQYQACNRTTCFLPTSIPVSWNLNVAPLDYERSPVSIRHK
jgi:hypothetical protein